MEKPIATFLQRLAGGGAKRSGGVEVGKEGGIELGKIGALSSSNSDMGEDAAPKGSSSMASIAKVREHHFF